MISGTRTAAVLACLTLTAGCGANTTDYQSLWTTSATTSAAQEEPLALGQYLQRQGVEAQAVAPESLKDLAVSIPIPKGWARRRNPQLPTTTEVINKGENVPIAILSVLKLDGDFDPAEAVKHGTVDTSLLPNFSRLDTSIEDFHGFPSAMIQGSHDAGGERMHSWYRVVLPTGSPPANQRYMVELTVITLAAKASEQAADVEAIINGFTVADK